MKSFFGAYSIVVAIFVALASASSCQARHFPANESSYLNFHIPTLLRHKDGWPHVSSSFGRFSHGKEGSLTLPVKMVHRKDQTLCNVDINDVGILEKLGILADEGSPFILLIERGVCTFVKKIRNAQQLGVYPVDVTPHDTHTVTNTATGAARGTS